jgi:hypothetical protein
MPEAKDIRVHPISSQDAKLIVKAHHYSGKVVPNSQLHLGVFLDGAAEGVMSFGPSMDKNKSLGLVPGTPWNGFLELNRMAFGPKLPRNSESRALGVAMRMIKKSYPHIQWVISYADGTQCGDGTIYRASGFVLTGINKNKTLLKLADGTIVARKTLNNVALVLKNGGSYKIPEGSAPLPGWQLRYMYFLHEEAKSRLAVPIIPFSKIAEMGASMYKGQKCAGSRSDDAP